MKSARCAGFTLAELLVVVGILAATAAVVVPSLSFGSASALSVAASETAHALRLARSEAVRSGRAVLVDAATAPGRLTLWYADCTAARPAGNFPPVTDPATRRAADFGIGGTALSGGVAVTPNFVAFGGAAHGGLVFDASGAATKVCGVTSIVDRGPPQPGSGIAVAIAGSTVMVTVDPPTGRVTVP